MEKDKKILFFLLVAIIGLAFSGPLPLLRAEPDECPLPPDRVDPRNGDENGEEEPIVIDPSRPTAPLRISTIQPTDAIIEDFSLTSPRLFQENR